MIITFYSYKGGVGRSMALANIAELLAQAGNKVLIIDWDLEAPGIERFFYNDVEEILGKPGLIDLLLDYKAQMATEWKNQPKDEMPFPSPKDFAFEVSTTTRQGRLLLLTSGKRSASEFQRYAENIRTFNWNEFYEKWEGELYFEWFKKECEEIADIVLIDSRTGVTEMGGVCTHQLADCVLLFCGANKQSLDGTLGVLQGIKLAEKVREKPIETLIIPSRVELAESTFLNAFRENFLELFSEFQPQVLKTSNESPWQLRIPYVSKYAFEEKLAITERYMAIAEDISDTFESIAHLLTRISVETFGKEIEIVKSKSRFAVEVAQSKARLETGLRVFLSSTYKDLTEYRAAAIRAVEGTSYQSVNIQVFGARLDEPLVPGSKEVEESRLFIGIYALRYGFIPDGADISITEMEYLHAKKLGKEIYCFLLDEENQPWLKKWIEGEPGKSKLDDFKKRMQKVQVCDYFTTPDDLRAKVSNALSHYVANLHPIPDSPIPVYQALKPTGSTLPQQPFFFGRADELKIIASALVPESRTWGALIDGPGGIGKTALAIKAAHDAPADLFERKIFITAKVRELTPEGEKSLKDFSRDNYFSMLNELALELGEDGIPRLAPEERANPLRRAMAGKKILIVFDNLETLPEGERVRLFQFLSRLPAGNKAIVTSRRRADVDARIIRLDRLSHDEAMQLVDELAARTPRLKRATPKERDELYEITQGNPLFIRWIAGQLGREGSQARTIAEACAFIEKAPNGNDPLEYIFGDLLETFTESETKVLAALTHFTHPAKLAWIAQMTELPERAAETALEDLADRSFLISNIESRTFYLPPLAAQFIKIRRPAAVIQTGDALTHRAYALAMQYGGDTNYEGFKTLDVEWELLAAALPRLLQGDNDRLQSVCNQLFRFFDFTGRWDEFLWLSEQAETRALAADDKDNAGWQAYRAGWLYQLRNQPDLVLACAARAAEHWQNGTPRAKAFAIRLRGVGHELQKDYPTAIAANREALEIYRSISPESEDVALALNSLAGAEQHNKDYLTAERDYREALRIAKTTNQREGIATYTGNLADLALDREQWVEAESLAREALALAEKVGRQQLIASDCHSIAKALLKQNLVPGKVEWRNLDEALSLSRRAVEIYTHLRVPDDLRAAQETLAEIEQARGGN
jgi:cellulose biosynthesis protein BcsQ/tetratricopeptide (TPR) repeat protein